MAVRVAPGRPSLAETNVGWGVRFWRFFHAVCTDDVAEVGAGETAGAKTVSYTHLTLPTIYSV